MLLSGCNSIQAFDIADESSLVLQMDPSQVVQSGSQIHSRRVTLPLFLGTKLPGQLS